MVLRSCVKRLRARPAPVAAHFQKHRAFSATFLVSVASPLDTSLLPKRLAECRKARIEKGRTEKSSERRTDGMSKG